MTDEQSIVYYLVNKYEPAGIILYGSRARMDIVHPASDWDLFVFSDMESNSVDDYSELRDYKSYSLDVSIYPTNVPENFILDTATHPVSDTRILFDTSNGKMSKIIEHTMLAYNKGPEALTTTDIAVRKRILNKYIRKVDAYPDIPGVTSFGSGFFLSYAVRYWFEVRNEWPLPINQAIAHIKSVDPEFITLLDELIGSYGNHKNVLIMMCQVRDALFVNN